MADFSRRDEFERKLARALGKAHQAEFKRLLEALGDQPDLLKIPPDYWETYAGNLRGIIQPLIEAIVIAQLEQSLSNTSIGVDLAIANERAAQWARQYSFELVKEITDKTRAALQEQIAGFYTDQRTLADLTESISRLYGPVRAEMIAITEVTRAASQGELVYASELEKLGLKTTQVWQTANDDTVCPICGPLDQKKQGGAWNDPPPAHPRCRCWTSTEVVK